MSRESIYRNDFIIPVEKTGKYTLLIAVACLFIPGLYLLLFHGLFPPMGALIRSLIGIWSFAIVFSILEPIIYFSLIGFGGTYMSFLSGNLLNLRFPISVTVQEVVGTKEGSPEGEIVSTLGVAGSLIASQLVLTVGVLVFRQLLGDLDAAGSSVSVALDNVLPALYGALAAMFLFKSLKLGIVPIVAGIAIALVNKGIPTSYIIAPMVVISVLSARYMYKKGWVKE